MLPQANTNIHNTINKTIKNAKIKIKHNAKKLYLF